MYDRSKSEKDEIRNKRVFMTKKIITILINNNKYLVNIHTFIVINDFDCEHKITISDIHLLDMAFRQIEFSNFFSTLSPSTS
jgi:hypothetical protein